jgi:DNA-binding transcriptional ArsR family regulator
MSKTMETKEHIIMLLKERKRTTTELAGELGLAKSTISQHISELESMGKIRAADNSFFRRVRHYEIAEMEKPAAATTQFQYRLGGALLVIIIASSISYYLYSVPSMQVPASSISQISIGTTQQIPALPLGLWIAIGFFSTVSVVAALYAISLLLRMHRNAENLSEDRWRQRRA